MTSKTNRQASKTLAFFARLLVVLCSLSFIACSRPPLESPADGGRPWIELRSKHFVVKTDHSRGDAHETAVMLENIYSAFEEVLYRHDPKPRFVTEIVLFRDEEALRELGYTWEGGVLMHRTGADLEERITLVTAGSLSRGDDAMRKVLQHELAHRFTAFYYRSAPVWLSEGLSEFYSTLKLEGGRAIAGAEVPGAAFTRADWGKLKLGSRVAFPFVPMSEAPSIAELRSHSPREFYGEAISQDPNNEAAIKKRAVNYAAAFHLLLVLKLGQMEHRLAFKAYLGELLRGRSSPSQAWQLHLGQHEASLERAYRALLAANKQPILSEPFHPKGSGEVTFGALEPAQTHLVWAGIRAATPAQAKLSAADLARAKELAPKSAEVQLAVGLAHLEAGDLPSASLAIEKARRLAGDDPRVLQAELVLAASQSDSATIESSGLKLAKRARTATQHALVAEVFLQRGQTAAAMRYAKKGLDLDFACWRCFRVLGLSSGARGNLDGAIQAHTTAMNLLNERDARRKALRTELEELTKNQPAQAH